MTATAKARAAFAILFLSGLFCAVAWNIHIQRDNLLGGLAGIALPRSLEDVRKACDRLGSLAARHLTGKYDAWESHAFLQQALGKTEMNDFSVIKGPDGRLYRGGLYPLYLDNAGKLAEAVAAFAAIAEEEGAKTLYLNAPDPVAKGAGHLPSAMPYKNYNSAQDAFLYALREHGVPALDARYAPFAPGIFPKDVAPKTAFLLRGESAFTVFSRLLEGLERQFAASLDPDGLYRDITNYTVLRYPDFFMGELGKETGPAFSGLDDFTTVAPAFATAFSYESLDMFGNFTKTEGSAEETILNPDALLYYENLYRLYPQSYYRHTNTAWSKIRNTLNPDGPKILVIHDFYSAQIISHLAPVCAEVHTLAYQENFSMSAAEYIRNNGFDYVVIAFFSQNLLRPEMRSLLAERQ